MVEHMSSHPEDTGFETCQDHGCDLLHPRSVPGFVLGALAFIERTNGLMARVCLVVKAGLVGRGQFILFILMNLTGYTAYCSVRSTVRGRVS